MKAEGELHDPSVTLSLRIANGSVDRIGFDLLAARMTFSEGVIIIEDGEILQGQMCIRDRFDGMLNLTDGVTEVSGTTEIAKLQIAQLEARGDILFRGELPGKTEYGAKISLTGGAAGIRGGLPWLRQAGGCLLYTSLPTG